MLKCVLGKESIQLLLLIAIKVGKSSDIESIVLIL